MSDTWQMTRDRTPTQIGAQCQSQTCVVYKVLELNHAHRIVTAFHANAEPFNTKPHCPSSQLHGPLCAHMLAESVYLTSRVRAVRPKTQTYYVRHPTERA